MVRNLGRDRRGRTPSGKTLKKKVFIYCEGESEKCYFDMLSAKYSSFTIETKRIERIGIKTKVVGNKGPLEIVNEAIRTLKRDSKKNDIHKAYVVFDNDQYSKEDIKKAIVVAENNSLVVLYSNINFDLWVLMHFEKVTCYLTKSDINKKLAIHYGVKSYSNEVKGELVSKPLRDRVKTASNNATSFFGNNKDSLMVSIEINPFVNIHNYLEEIFQVSKL